MNPDLRLIADRIRNVPDFPRPGILFKDITPLLADPLAFHAATEALAAPYHDSRIDLVVGIEARGFIIGAPIAHQLRVGFVPIRKKGKLPGDTIEHHYDLEYGTDALEIHHGAIERGQHVLIVDDLLATGGTAQATVDLIKRAGGDVRNLAFLIELEALNGRARLGDLEIFAALKY
mgnify:CR=1 FL=1